MIVVEGKLRNIAQKMVVQEMDTAIAGLKQRKGFQMRV
jgi:hypothetical protein